MKLPSQSVLNEHLSKHSIYLSKFLLTKPKMNHLSNLKYLLCSKRIYHDLIAVKKPSESAA